VLGSTGSEIIRGERNPNASEAITCR